MLNYFFKMAKQNLHWFIKIVANSTLSFKIVQTGITMHQLVKMDIVFTNFKISLVYVFCIGLLKLSTILLSRFNVTWVNLFGSMIAIINHMIGLLILSLNFSNLSY